MKSVQIQRQRGIGLLGLMFWAALLVVVVGVGLKTIPAYIEFFSVKKIIAAMAEEPGFQDRTNGELRSGFGRRAVIDYVTVLKPEDLIISRSSGKPVVTAQYEFRTKLVGNISLVIDFFASTDPDAKPAAAE